MKTRNALFWIKLALKGGGGLEYAEYAFFGVMINKKELNLAALYCLKKSFKNILPLINILYTIYNGILTLFVELWRDVIHDPIRHTQLIQCKVQR